MSKKAVIIPLDECIGLSEEYAIHIAYNSKTTKTPHLKRRSAREVAQWKSIQHHLQEYQKLITGKATNHY